MLSYGARQEAFRNSLSDAEGSEITVAKVTSPEGLSEALYQSLITSDVGVGEVSGLRGPVLAVPPLR